MKRRLLTLVFLVGGCDMRPEHPEWQNQCVESHTDVTYLALPVPDSSGRVTIQLQPQYNTVCDRAARVCVAGRDGSTECRR
jgi:hypothetical protein